MIGLQPSNVHSEHGGISHVMFGSAVFACIDVQARVLALYIDLDEKTSKLRNNEQKLRKTDFLVFRVKMSLKKFEFLRLDEQLLKLS